ncbi:MAG TPA: hypothetical protein VFM18_09945 [Methanosarcina sp.]|nr:hypothetical protein [Methanosarcina sp.]
MMSFHEWKDHRIRDDSKQHGVFRYYHPKDWYWQEYGRYCNKMRKLMETQNEQTTTQAC